MLLKLMAYSHCMAMGPGQIQGMGLMDRPNSVHTGLPYPVVPVPFPLPLFILTVT